MYLNVYDLVAPTASLDAINMLKWPPQFLYFVSVRRCLNSNILSMKVGTGGNLGLSREYHKKLFGPLFIPWWNCPLM